MRWICLSVAAGVNVTVEVLLFFLFSRPKTCTDWISSLCFFCILKSTSWKGKSDYGCRDLNASKILSKIVDKSSLFMPDFETNQANSCFQLVNSSRRIKTRTWQPTAVLWPKKPKSSKPLIICLDRWKSIYFLIIIWSNEGTQFTIYYIHTILINIIFIALNIFWQIPDQISI